LLEWYLQPYRMNSFFSSGWGNSAFHSRGNSGYHFHISQYTDQAKAYKAQIDTWFERVVKEENDSVEYFRSILKPFVEQELSNQKTKTLKLPGLSIQLRKKPDRVEVTDKETAISFCEEIHPDAIVVKKDVSKAYLKDLLIKKGELVPGCDIVAGTETIYVKNS
jgi:phage host-nuclease inhibitor protein Gam